MNTLGLFAGRGDVVLAMGLACLVGVYIGYKLHGWKVRLSNFKRKGNKE